jgi:hypothetical protein
LIYLGNLDKIFTKRYWKEILEGEIILYANRLVMVDIKKCIAYTLVFKANLLTRG